MECVAFVVLWALTHRDRAGSERWAEKHLIYANAYKDFRAYLQDHFTLLNVLTWGEQQLKVYSRSHNP